MNYSIVSWPADWAHSPGVLRTWRIAEVVLFDEAFGTAAGRDSNSTVSRGASNQQSPPTYENWSKDGAMKSVLALPEHLLRKLMDWQND